MSRLVVRTRLTVTGFGSESSSGHILNRGCPNSCVLESVPQRRVLLTKLEPFFSFLTRLHLGSVGEATFTYLCQFSPDLVNYQSRGKQRKAEETSQCLNLPPFCHALFKLTVGRR